MMNFLGVAPDRVRSSFLSLPWFRAPEAASVGWDDTGRVDVPTLRSTTTGDDAGAASSVGPDPEILAGIPHQSTISALLHSATKNPERAKEFRSLQTPGARYQSGRSLAQRT